MLQWIHDGLVVAAFTEEDFQLLLFGGKQELINNIIRINLVSSHDVLLGSLLHKKLIIRIGYSKPN